MKRLSETFAAFIFTLSLLDSCGSTEGSHPGYHPGTGTGTSISTSTSTGSGTGTGTGTSTGTGTTTTVHANLMGGAIQKQLTLTGAVTTYAGSVGVSGSADGAGTAAQFDGIWGITTDGTNLYVADSTKSTIRKVVIATGVVTTLAGSVGVAGSIDGTGTAAQFHYPMGVTTDGANLYVTDSGNYTIRKVVIATGTVTTLAGSVGAGNSIDGTGTAAHFGNPRGITTDGTNLYVADSAGNVIRKVVIATGVVTTLAGSVGVAGSIDGTGTAAQFNRPDDVTTDGTNLYVTDYHNFVIRKVVIATGAVTTLAGSAGSTAWVLKPEGITTDGTNLYVTDNGLEILKVVIATGVVTSLAGQYIGSADGTGTAARFNYPMGVTTDGTNLYVTDSRNYTIRKIQ